MCGYLRQIRVDKSQEGCIIGDVGTVISIHGLESAWASLQAASSGFFFYQFSQYDLPPFFSAIISFMASISSVV